MFTSNNNNVYKQHTVCVLTQLYTLHVFEYKFNYIICVKMNKSKELCWSDAFSVVCSKTNVIVFGQLLQFVMTNKQYIIFNQALHGGRNEGGPSEGSS